MENTRRRFRLPKNLYCSATFKKVDRILRLMMKVAKQTSKYKMLDTNSIHILEVEAKDYLKNIPMFKATQKYIIFEFPFLTNIYFDEGKYISLVYDPFKDIWYFLELKSTAYIENGNVKYSAVYTFYCGFYVTINENGAFKVEVCYNSFYELTRKTEFDQTLKRMRSYNLNLHNIIRRKRQQ